MHEFRTASPSGARLSEWSLLPFTSILRDGKSVGLEVPLKQAAWAPSRMFATDVFASKSGGCAMVTFLESMLLGGERQTTHAQTIAIPAQFFPDFRATVESWTKQLDETLLATPSAPADLPAGVRLPDSHRISMATAFNGWSSGGSFEFQFSEIPSRSAHEAKLALNETSVEEAEKAQLAHLSYVRSIITVTAGPDLGAALLRLLAALDQLSD